MMTRNSPSDHNIMPRVLANLTTVLSLIALIISLAGLFYTARTYSVVHRPYIGIVEMPFLFVGKPPQAIVWKLVMKNVGNIPSFVTVDEFSASLTTPNGIIQLPHKGKIGEKTGTMLMPGQTTDLVAQYSEFGGKVAMKDIIEGTTRINSVVRLTYDSKGWFWNNNFRYKATFIFHTVKGFPPGFAMINAEAD